MQAAARRRLVHHPGAEYSEGTQDLQRVPSLEILKLDCASALRVLPALAGEPMHSGLARHGITSMTITCRDLYSIPVADALDLSAHVVGALMALPSLQGPGCARQRWRTMACAGCC